VPNWTAMKCTRGDFLAEAATIWDPQDRFGFSWIGGSMQGIRRNCMRCGKK